MITQEIVRSKLHYKDGKLFWIKFGVPGQEAGCARPDGRWVIRVNKKLYLRSRLVWLYHNETLPVEIDHDDIDCSNDRIENLVASDRYHNNGNTKATGVTHVRGRYIARIFERGQPYHLGSFDTFDQAHTAYLTKRQELRG